jgi:PmbA protein
VCDDVDGRKQTDGESSVARALALLLSPEAVAQVAVARTKQRRGARKISTDRLPVIFEPQVARGFLAAIVSALSGDAIAQRRSFLCEKLGTQVLRAGHSLVDDPHVVGGFGSRAFDGEAQMTRAETLIDSDGILVHLLLDAKSAARLKRPRAGHAGRGVTSLPSPAPSNILLSGGEGDLAGIIKDTARGLLVTRLLGHSPDVATGMYSRGAAGFFIEDGQIAFPVDEVTVASTMDLMMRGIDRVGDDIDGRGSIRAQTLRFAEMSVSGR